MVDITMVFMGAIRVYKPILYLMDFTGDVTNFHGIFMRIVWDFDRQRCPIDPWDKPWKWAVMEHFYMSYSTHGDMESRFTINMCTNMYIYICHQTCSNII